jgi:hypothetical protein
MTIQENALNHWIKNFYGYGSWHAKLWFVAYEEGGGELPEEVAEKINYLFKVHPSSSATLCDIRDLYKHVSIYWDGPQAGKFDNRFEYRFGKNAIQHGLWKNLIRFVQGYRNEQIQDLLEYQKNIFASPKLRTEALLQFYPLPSPHNHAWYYSWLDLPQLGFLKSRELYESHLYESRIQALLSNIKAYKPDVVLMYGMVNISRLKHSIQEIFPGREFKMIKATKMQIPQHHRTDLNGTKLIITTQIPALRHNRIETGFDWFEFGKRVNA